MTQPGGCRITLDTVAGWQAIHLENGLIRAGLLPDKGAELYRLMYLPADIDVLLQAPWGLQPPGAPPREGSGDHEFEANYPGGWQELFPSAHYACTYQGKSIPFHGEVATVPWAWRVVEDTAETAAILFTVRCRQTPFRLERLMRVRRGEGTLFFEETIYNESEAPAHFVWGQHCVVGAPFLEAGCRLYAPARVLHTGPEAAGPTTRLVPGQTAVWPMAQALQGGTVDLRDILGPEAHTLDVAFLTDLAGGWVAVTNPRLNLTFSLHWDAAVFKWLIVWQPYGGCEAMPLRGTYGLGIEPWTARYNLSGALAEGEAIELAGGGQFSTALRATVTAGGWVGE